MLEDPIVPDDALDITDVLICQEEEEDYQGFSVFGKKLCIFGNAGLSIANATN